MEPPIIQFGDLNMQEVTTNNNATNINTNNTKFITPANNNTNKNTFSYYVFFTKFSDRGEYYNNLSKTW